jgi:hypothetical protein
LDPAAEREGVRGGGGEGERREGGREGESKKVREKEGGREK